jgi:hypothetical protein
MERLSELFPAGPPIGEEQQIGRRGFIDSIEERLRGGDVLILADARRVGKTSVARAALARIAAAGGTIAEVNLATHGPDHLGAATELAQELAGSLGRQASNLGGAARRLRAAGGGDGATEGAAVLALTAELLGPRRRIDTVIAQAAARAGERSCAILLDEAHVVGSWPADVQQALNAALRDSARLGIIVASSERHALERLLDEDQTLYLAGYPMRLPEIDASTWLDGLRPRFQMLGADLASDVLRILIEQAHGHPYCTMRLCAESALQAEHARRLKGDGRPVVDELAVAAALSVVHDDPVWKAVIG